MNKKRLWLIIAVLLVMNVISFVLLLTSKPSADDEVVATIGKEKITRLDWLGEMEKRYGRDLLSEMIDQKVIATLAEKYDVTVSDKAVERQMLLLKTLYGTTTSEGMDEKQWQEQIRYSLLLDELLTKDVKVREAEMKEYYQENKKLYEIPTSYHASHIVVKTEKEAKQVVKELEQGSDFATLAMERSIDEFSSKQGGDIGYLNEESDQFPASYLDAVQKLDKNDWSAPIPIESGYAVLLRQEEVKGKKFAYKDVKDSIRRQIALEQMDVNASARDFWEQANVNWLYGEE